MNKNDLNEDLKPDERVWMPGEIGKDVQHFNVFRLKHDRDEKFDCQPFHRRQMYRISLLKGKTRLYYADKTVDLDCALLFSNPNIPYAWEHLGTEQTAYFCVFTDMFFDQFINIKEYPVFKPGNIPLFHLNAKQFTAVERIFKQMLSEIPLEFSYKYDSLRTMVLQLIFMALKLEPAICQQYNDSNGSQRISSIFMELLERQFPIESNMQRLGFRYPSEFANQLSIHVNHLNHALKSITGKTTSQLISERIMQEARSLLQHTDWNISEIAWSLGFDDTPHFIKFFKRGQQLTPKHYRKVPAIG